MREKKSNINYYILHAGLGSGIDIHYIVPQRKPMFYMFFCCLSSATMSFLRRLTLFMAYQLNHKGWGGGVAGERRI